MDILLLALGFAVGAYGALIGAGGGFVLVPALLLLYPVETPKLLTSISLAVVFFNALSGTVAYTRMGRVDFRSGVPFALATVPGAIIGAYVIRLLARGPFDLTFGLVLVALSGLIFFNPASKRKKEVKDLAGHVTRRLTSLDGTVYSYSFSKRFGVGLSFGVGLFSSLLGIGGGVIHVPALVHLLGFPTHIATATSLFVLVTAALTGTVTHIFLSDLTGGWYLTFILAIGVIVGAQLGARLSVRVKGTIIVRLLALALALVGLRLIYGAF